MRHVIGRNAGDRADHPPDRMPPSDQERGPQRSSADPDRKAPGAGQPSSARASPIGGLMNSLTPREKPSLWTPSTHKK